MDGASYKGGNCVEMNAPELWFSKCHLQGLLVAQWLRLVLPMQRAGSILSQESNILHAGWYSQNIKIKCHLLTTTTSSSS